MALFLLRPGELSLKKGKRSFFEKLLKTNVKRRLKGESIRLYGREGEGRFYIECDDAIASRVERVLSFTYGLADYHLCRAVELNEEALKEATLDEAALYASNNDIKTFKLEVKRVNKGFGENSYVLACKLGGDVLDAYPNLKVNVIKPDLTIHVEIREKAYIYAVTHKGGRGLGGLPVGSSGKAMLLLSGGIDSPVAGSFMMKRGLKIECVHFHTPPYTGGEALDKTRALAALMAPYNGGSIRFWPINFTPVQLKIAALGEPAYVTLLSRACMMTIADRLAKKLECEALVTGEALSQVASQTLPALSFTDSVSDLIVLRPLIGLDKAEIIDRAIRLGFYETSIQSGTDCCSLFAPAHPILNPNRDDCSALMERGDFSSLIDEAVTSAVAEYFNE